MIKIMITKKKQNIECYLQLPKMRHQLLQLAILLLLLQVSICGYDSSEHQAAISEDDNSTSISTTMNLNTNDSAPKNTTQPETTSITYPITSNDKDDTIPRTEIINTGSVNLKGKIYSKESFSDLIKQNFENMYLINQWSLASTDGQMTSFSAFDILQNYINTKDKKVSQDQLPLLVSNIAEEIRTKASDYNQSVVDK